MSGIKKIIIDEIYDIFEYGFNPGTFRRLVISSELKNVIKSEVEKMLNRHDIKNNYDFKYTIKSGVNPNTIVIDLNGSSVTALASKISDIAKKHDKKVKIVIRKEKPIK